MAIKAFSRSSKLSVQARATSKVAPKAKAAAPASTKSNNLTILAKLSDLGILSSVEKAGLLSTVEKAGLLSKAEELGLLSFAEKSGALKIIADPSTPGSLTAAGFLLVVAAVASAYAGEGAVDIAAVAFGLAGVTAFVAGSALDKIQKL